MNGTTMPAAATATAATATAAAATGTAEHDGPAGAAPPDPGPVPMTEHELAALIGVGPGPAATLSAQALGLSELVRIPQVDRAGWQTLLLRGLGRLDEESVTAVGPAHVIAGVLTTAAEWALLDVSGPGFAEGCAIVASPAGALLVEYRPTGVHPVTPIDPARSPFDVVAFALENLRTHPGPLDARVRRLTAATPEVAVRLRRRDDSAWEAELGLLAAASGPLESIWPSVRHALEARGLPRDGAAR